jgi:hypothetical protein
MASRTQPGVVSLVVNCGVMPLHALSPGIGKHVISTWEPSGRIALALNTKLGTNPLTGSVAGVTVEVQLTSTRVVAVCPNLLGAAGGRMSHHHDCGSRFNDLNLNLIRGCRRVRRAKQQVRSQKRRGNGSHFRLPPVILRLMPFVTKSRLVIIKDRTRFVATSRFSLILPVLAARI